MVFYNCYIQDFYLFLLLLNLRAMKQAILLLAAALTTSVVSNAQEVASSESWSGKIAIGQNALNIGFVMKTLSDGQQICVMNVPEQGAKGIPVELLKNDSDSLSLSISVLRATYKGHKTSSNSIEGIFSQNGLALPLVLHVGGWELKRPQTPIAPFSYVTEEIVFRNQIEGAELAGTLTYPKNFETCKPGTVPVVLMVTGSGSQNRNEELFGHKPFLVIADFLAKNGIASLRYDDRGVGKSKGTIKGLTTENNLADAEAGIAYLRSLKQFGKVGVLGHSEGGTIAFMMGANKSVDFLISCAGGAANGIDILVRQNETLMKQQGVFPKLINDYAAALRMIFKDRISGKKIENESAYIADLCQANGFNLPESFKSNLMKCITYAGEWLTWFLAYNPENAIRKIECPVMALNGELDLQVLSEDNLSIIKDNLPPNKNHFIKQYDSLNHFFQHCTPATAINYGSIEETFSEEVLTDMVNWIHTVK